MFKLIDGCHIDNIDGIKESYTINDNSIIANVSKENIRHVFDNFINLTNEKDYFLFLEVPVNINEEEIIRESTDKEVGIINGAHVNVYYLDGIPKHILLALLDEFDELLINDGISNFGIGTKDAREIGKYRYNKIILYANDTKNYESIFSDLNIKQDDNFNLVDSVISPENIGTCERIIVDDVDIYKLVDSLKELGLYKAETRLENDMEVEVQQND